MPNIQTYTKPICHIGKGKRQRPIFVEYIGVNRETCETTKPSFKAQKIGGDLLEEFARTLGYKKDE